MSGCWCRLTKLAHFQNLTEHLGQFDTAAAKWTLVLVFSTAVLKHNLQTQTIKWARQKHEDHIYSVLKNVKYFSKMYSLNTITDDPACKLEDILPIQRWCNMIINIFCDYFWHACIPGCVEYLYDYWIVCLSFCLFSLSPGWNCGGSGSGEHYCLYLFWKSKILRSST